MALEKVVFEDKKTVIPAKILNDIQDAVIALERELPEAIDEYLEENPIEAVGVKTVNGVKPDGNGNVKIDVGSFSSVEPADDDIPKVFITGVKPTTKDDVLAEMDYFSKGEQFHAYLTIKCQGTSSMNYAKKNFTIKMYKDEARSTKLKKIFKDWDHNGNKYVLKANWIDHTHARNIVSARLWSEVVESRPDYNSLPAEMRSSPRNGAVDGFPVKVYYNGTYEGIYTWNIGKDDWMWNMDEDNPNHILLCAESNTDGVYKETPCNFRKTWGGTDGMNWSVEVGTNSTAVKNSLNRLISFVMENDGDDFRNGIGNYLDIQSAIDYYIFQYEICGLDGLAKNMLLATYDLTVWYCGAYDMDSTFGLWIDGGKFVSATYACPENYQEQFSLLWERIEANFMPELKARQAELRNSVLSYANMVTHFERFMDTIGLDLYAEDLTIYNIPSAASNNIKQIRNYIRDRQAYVDAEFAAMVEPVACEGILLSDKTLTFTAEGTQTISAMARPLGCTETMVWVSSNPSVATISVDGAVCTVNAVANGTSTITVTCGAYSASCTVSVSGIAEPVPCTGITLNMTQLIFSGEGSQTLTATVVPSNTTDEIVWSSDNTTVARVENGIVTAVDAGSATITATCGTKSASCAVSVVIPMDYTKDALANATWLANTAIDNNSGNIKSSTGDHLTEMISLQECVYQFTIGSGNNYARIGVYDADGNYVGFYEKSGNFKFFARSDYKYRIKVYGDTSKVTLLPIDNSANAVHAVWNLKDLTWGTANNVADATLSAEQTAFIKNNVDQCGDFVFVDWSAIVARKAVNARMYELFNDGTVYHLRAIYFNTGELASAHFAENNTVLEFNKRYK